MTEFRYLQVFGDSSDALYAQIGVNFEDAAAGAYFTLETHIRHIAEAKAETALWSESEILAYDEKRLHLFHRLYGDQDQLLGTGEHLSVHVCASKVTPAAPSMIERISEIFESQRHLPVPEGTGSVLKKPLEFTR
jgi:acyl-CoA thioester hydrolase/carnitine 3-dehydrogenase